MKLLLFLLTAILLSGCGSPSSNLLRNGSAESPRYDSVPAGWTNVKGSWTALEGDSLHHDYGFAQDSNHYFFAGNCSLGILQQDIDVSSYSSGIDAKRQKFMFSAFVLSLDQGPNSDQAEVRVIGLGQSKKDTLYNFDSDTLRSISKWLHVEDTFIAPPFTRWLRVQLMCVRHVGGDNDGYLDNIILTTSAKPSVWLWVIIAAGVALVAGMVIFVVRKRRGGNHRGPNSESRHGQRYQQSSFRIKKPLEGRLRIFVLLRGPWHTIFRTISGRI